MRTLWADWRPGLHEDIKRKSLPDIHRCRYKSLREKARRWDQGEKITGHTGSATAQYLFEYVCENQYMWWYGKEKQQFFLPLVTMRIWVTKDLTLDKEHGNTVSQKIITQCFQHHVIVREWFITAGHYAQFATEHNTWSVLSRKFHCFSQKSMVMRPIN